VIDTTKEEVQIPIEKISLLRENLMNLVSQQQCIARQLAGIAGRLISVARAFSPARLFTRSFYQLIKEHQHLKWDWDTVIVLQESELVDARWLIENLEKFNGRMAWPPAVLLTLHTDASSTVGWGGKLLESHAQGAWNKEERQLHINVLELRAVAMALRSFKSLLGGQALQVALDSTVAVSYLENGGGKQKELSKEVRIIWELLVEMGTTLVRTFWIPSKENPADSLSRRKDFEDWRVSQDIFQLLEKKWGPHSVDRSTNAKLKIFNSFLWCPGTSAVNAFGQQWRGVNNYVCPPARLIHQVLLHIKECQAEATVIVPSWGGQPWWPLLQELKIDELMLPHPRISFQEGLSGAVEPWRNDHWRYLAVRVGVRK